MSAADEKTRAAMRQGKALGKLKGAAFAYVRKHDEQGKAEDQAVWLVRAAVRLVHALALDRMVRDEVDGHITGGPSSPDAPCACEYCQDDDRRGR